MTNCQSCSSITLRKFAFDCRSYLKNSADSVVSSRGTGGDADGHEGKGRGIAPVFVNPVERQAGRGAGPSKTTKESAMRLTLSICLALSLASCGKYQNEQVAPASRQQINFNYGDRPMTLIWSSQVNTIVPRTPSKVLQNRDVAGIATITYGAGRTLLPSDAANIIRDVLGCTMASTVPGYGQDGPSQTMSARIHCRS